MAEDGAVLPRRRRSSVVAAYPRPLARLPGRAAAGGDVDQIRKFGRPRSVARDRDGSFVEIALPMRG